MADALTGYPKYRRGVSADHYILSTNPVLWISGRRDGAIFTSDDAYGHTCTKTGALWRPQGYDFDGVDDKISVPNNALFNFGASTDFSIEIVFKVTDPTIQQNIFNKMDAGTGVGIFFNTYSDASGKTWTRLLQDAGNKCILYSSNALPANTFVHRVIRRIGTSLSIVCNGVLDTATQEDTGLGGASNGDTTESVRLGLKGDNSLDMGGIIGEVRIYCRGLSVAECLRNYNATRARYV